MLHGAMLGWYLLAALADSATYAAMGAHRELNPVVVHLAGTDPALPFLLKLAVVLLVLLIPPRPYPKLRLSVCLYGAILWSFGALTNVATIL